LQFVYLNGQYVEAEKATVSVYDRCFLYGDGLFETLRTYQGRCGVLGNIKATIYNLETTQYYKKKI
jgi:branched-subunit amino acid aminotransferase/4-amino-4-deoxychorismate lyase